MCLYWSAYTTLEVKQVVWLIVQNFPRHAVLRYLILSLLSSPLHGRTSTCPTLNLRQLCRYSHRRTRRGVGRAPPPPGFGNLKASSVFRTSATWSKILNNKKYLNTVKNSRATLFFRASASCSKILNNKKYIFSTVNSGPPLFFRASANYSKILNEKVYSIQWKIAEETLFSRQAQVVKNPECKKYSIFTTVKLFGATLFLRASASCSKILNDKSIFSAVKIFRATLFFRASASCWKILNDKIYIQCSENFQATLCFSGQAQVVEKSAM